MDQATTETTRTSGADGLVVDLENLPCRTDAGIGAEAALGLLVLETDQTIEDEFRFLLPATGIALYGARLHNDAIISPDARYIAFVRSSQGRQSLWIRQLRGTSVLFKTDGEKIKKFFLPNG